MLEIKAKQPLPATEVDDVQYDLENAQDLLHKKDEQIEQLHKDYRASFSGVLDKLKISWMKEQRTLEENLDQVSTISSLLGKLERLEIILGIRKLYIKGIDMATNTVWTAKPNTEYIPRKVYTYQSDASSEAELS